MRYKVKTAVTTEPVSLTEVKSHINSDSETLAGGMTTYQSISPASYPVSNVIGTGIDILGKVALINLNSGTVGGTVTAKIQDSDDNVTYTDYSSFTVVTSANDNAIQEVEYTGTKRYVRVYAAVSGSTGIFGADVIVKSGETDEDTYLSELITAAREYCENFTRRALATQTIEAYLDTFPYDEPILLPKPPLQSVTSVKYKDSDGNETTMTATTEYLVDTDNVIGSLVLPHGDTWPTFSEYPINPIKIEYVCGYYSSFPIPKAIKHAILLLVGHWYAKREPVGTASSDIEASVHSLLSQYRVGWF